MFVQEQRDGIRKRFLQRLSRQLWSLIHDVVVGVGLGCHVLIRLLQGVLRNDSSATGYFAHRFGFYIRRLPEFEQPVFWLHGVSVGEVLAMDVIIGALRASARNGIAVVLSTMTADGLRAVQRLTNKPDASFIYPLDVSALANAIAKRLRPRALVLVDGDFWLQMLRCCRKHGAGVMVMNGRISSRSVKNYSRIPAYSRELFSCLDLVSVQSEQMVSRFAELSVPASRIVVDGNIKVDISTPPMDEFARSALIRKYGLSPRLQCLVFGSIHPAELTVLSLAIRKILAARNDIQIVIAPRHPEKFNQTVLTTSFPNVRSTWYGSHEQQRHSENAELIWVNQIGVLRDFYQVAQLAFVGGTFCDVGGHNLLEPVHFGVPVLYGPDVSGQLPLHELLQTFQVGWQVRSEDDLIQAAMRILDDPELGLQLGKNAALLRNNARDTTNRIVRHIAHVAGL
jgi:3-deoxy-D-manno-octulosonic-acid transferase